MTKVMKVGAKGQIVIPQDIRDELGVRPGDHVSVRSEDGEVRVRRLIDLEDLRGSLGSAPMSEVEKIHRDEVALEEKKAARWSE